MQAIILVGGFGTRLKSVLRDLPKPMAPIEERPFLSYLLHYLKKQGISQVIFSVYHLSDKIERYFASHYAGIDIYYVKEKEPLGTGGAIKNALSAMSSFSALSPSKQPIFVLNGDTFVKLDYRAMFAFHTESQSPFTMALRESSDCSRYGEVVTKGKEIIAFQEKGKTGSGLMNVGVYLMQRELFSSFNSPIQFSLEKDFLLAQVKKLKPKAFITDDYFIDIGIPKDYARAILDLPLMND